MQHRLRPPGKTAAEGPYAASRKAKFDGPKGCSDEDSESEFAGWIAGAAMML